MPAAMQAMSFGYSPVTPDPAHREQQKQLHEQMPTTVGVDYPQHTEQWMSAPPIGRQPPITPPDGQWNATVVQQANATTMGVVASSAVVAPPNPLPMTKEPSAPTTAPPAKAPLTGGNDQDQAPAGGDPPKKKRNRQCRPKVKTGCQQCKLRRIKCDEARPACKRCITAGKKCHGYPPIARSARPHEQVKILPKPVVAIAASAAGTVAITSNHVLYPRRAQKALHRAFPATVARARTPPLTPPMGAVFYHPMSGLKLHHSERQYFHLFQEHTAGELSGYFDDLFWSRMVLQECYTADSIRHAVVALGALYKMLERASDSPPNSPTGGNAPMPREELQRHWEVAMNQYSAAINALMVLSKQERQPHRTMLMGAVLLACFDSFVGDHQNAILQIQAGLELLEKLREEHRRANLPPDQEPVEEELIQMFNRLAIQAKSYDMAFHFPEPYVIRLTPSRRRLAHVLAHNVRDPYSPPAEKQAYPPPLPPASLMPPVTPIPPIFTNLREARLVWDRLCERMLRFTEILMDNNTPSDRPRGILPDEIKHVGRGFHGQLQAWSSAYDMLLSSRMLPTISWQEKAGIAVLKMFQIMGTILFLMTFSDSEMPFDGFKPQFQAIVDLALEVVGDEERRAAARQCPEAAAASQQCRHRARAASSSLSMIIDGHSFNVMPEYQHTASHLKASFCADLGIVPPLYVVATKCRDPFIRRQAIQILRSSPRREGMWDSGLTARIGSWVMEHEESIEREVTELETTPSAPIVSGTAPYSYPDSPHTSAPSPPSLGSHITTTPAPMRCDSAIALPPRYSSIYAPPGRWGMVPIPEHQRVMVKSVHFSLQGRWATLLVGTRAQKEMNYDQRRRQVALCW